MVARMSNKIELFAMATVSLVSGLFTDAFTQIAMSVLAMLVSTTVGFYWKKVLIHLEKRSKTFSRLRAALRKKDNSKTPQS